METKKNIDATKNFVMQKDGSIELQNDRTYKLSIHKLEDVKEYKTTTNQDGSITHKVTFFDDDKSLEATFKDRRVVSLEARKLEIRFKTDDPDRLQIY